MYVELCASYHYDQFMIRKFPPGLAQRLPTCGKGEIDSSIIDHPNPIYAPERVHFR
jgi:hypothetical protein